VPVRPLDDIRVLDLTHFYNGPYGTLLLSYLGADVIKIEPPGHGEGMRALYRAPGREISIGFAILNVNKRSLTLNLKSEEGRDLFKRMVARADVVAENFAYGAMEGFGLGYEVLRAINPRLIYATGKGYGLSGPYRDLPAFDPVVQAMSGVLSTTG
jgi:CoA:oxalate CoA-transferase